MVALAPSLGTLAALWWWPGSLGGLVYGFGKLILYGVPAMVAWRTVSRGQIAQGLGAGFSRSSVVWGLGSGLVIGGLILALWFGFLRGKLNAAALQEVVEANGLADPLRYWLMAIWMSVGNAFLEEFAFRWFVDSRLQKLGLPVGLILPISALIFTAHHVLVLLAYFSVSETVIFSAGVFMGGLLWSWIRLREGSLVPGWISHLLVDVAVFVVGASLLFAV